MKIKKKKKYLVKFDEVFDEILDYNEEKKVFHISHIYDLFVLENKKSFVQNKMNRNKKKQQQPVWVNKWFLRFVCLEKPFEHWLQRNGHVPWWICVWPRRSPGVANVLSQ